MKDLIMRIYSDIHQEIREKDEDYFNVDVYGNEKEQILIIAGDYDQINRYNKTYKGTTDRYDKFKSLCERFKYVLYVFGNHEYYQGKIGAAYSEKNLRFTKDIPNLYILSRNTSSITINNFKFIGATLWTPLKEVIHLDKNNISDVTQIKQQQKGRYSSLHADFIRNENLLDLNWIKSEVEKSELPVIIITHHSPVLISDPRYKNDRWLHHNCNDLSEYIKNNSKIKCWIYGHIHQKDKMAFMIGSSILFSNTIGSKLEKDLPERSLLTFKDLSNADKMQ